MTAVSDALSTITLGGGCFWCTQAVFERVRGVLSAESGYANGHTPNPHYDAVCTGQTGHAEVVQLRWDPAQVSLTSLLEVFFLTHDPTTLNRQGADVGTQYRSGIYWHDPAQRETIEEVLATVRAAHTVPVVTEVEALRSYTAAEAYHQQYFEHHPHQGYCAYVVAPKVQKFLKTCAQLVK